MWGGEGSARGERALRALARAARLCTNAHSVVLLAWLASVGAAHVGERIARRDEGPVERDRFAAHREPVPSPGGVPSFVPADGAIARSGARMGKLAGALDRLTRAVGGPLGWIVRLAVPGTTRAWGWRIPSRRPSRSSRGTRSTG